MVRRVVLGVLMVLCGGLAEGLSARESFAATPNVVLILGDDQAWTDYGFMGHRQIETPALDKLAAESLVFTRGYVPTSLCRPSLASIITGLYPHQHKIVGNDPPPPADLAGKPKAEYTRSPRYLEQREAFLVHIDRAPKLPALLQPQYTSLQTGKWWEGAPRRGGFTEGMSHGDPSRGGRHGDVGLTIGRQGMKPIFDFIDRQGEKPFCVWYAPIMPHLPHTPPARLLDKYKAKTEHLAVAKYWAMCEWFDETIGELLKYLDEKKGADGKPLAENTIVVFVTDNGWVQLPKEGGGPFGGPRGKRSQYDGGLRTPILVRWPEKIKPRRDTTHAVSSIDILPTVLKHTLGKSVPSLPGIDLLDEQAVASRPAIFGSLFDHDVQHMTEPAASLQSRWVIAGEWKLVVPFTPRQPQAEVELYHLAQDPEERRNLASQQPERVQQLRQRLDGWWPAALKNAD